jgi:uncharacterized coiled-coil protein SlyX
MKKKIINGFLMVALLAATVTSFVSCKDNDEDVKTDLIAQLQKQAVDLKTAWQTDDATLRGQITDAYQAADAQVKQDAKDYTDAREQAVKDWVNGEGYLKKTEFPATLAEELVKNQDFIDLKDKLDDAADDISALQDIINDPEKGIDAINDKINDPETGIDAINDKLEDIKDKLEELQKDFKNLITSVNVNATSTSLLANSKIFPGLNVQFVGAAFGKAVTTTGTFPTSTTADINGNKLDANYIAEGITPYEWEKGIINNKENNAGKVYFTVNPSNISANVLNNTVALSLTTSDNNEELVTLDNVKASDKALSWGTTRGDSKVTLFEADATYDLKDAEAIDPAELIDFSAIKNSVKNIIDAAKTVNIPDDATKAEAHETASTAKAASKTVLKELAQVVANLVNTKIPALPALALKAEWKDNNVGTRNVISDYSLAATAYKPLSFNFGKANGEILPNISLDRIDNAVFKVTKRINNALTSLNSKLNINISTITYDASGFKVNETVNLFVTYKIVGTEQVIDQIKLSKNATETGYTKLTSFTITKNFKDDIDAMITAVNNGIPTTEINNLVAEAQKYINKAKSATSKTDKLVDSATDYLESYINRAINFVNNGGISRALEPILLVNTENGICRATGAYKAGEFTFVPTTVTYEIAAPAFKKYIAVIGKDGKARAADSKLLTKGDNNFSAVKLNLQQGDTKIVYDAMDFTGRHIIKVYDITVE